MKKSCVQWTHLFLPPRVSVLLPNSICGSKGIGSPCSPPSPPPPPGAAFPSRNAQQTKPRSGQLDTVAVQLTGHQHLQQSRASYCQHTFACGIYSPISKLSWPVDRHQPTLLIGTAHGAIRFPHTKEEPLFGLAGRAVSVVHWMKSKQAPMWSLLRGTQEPSLTGLNCMCGWLLWCVKQFEPVHVLDSWQAMTVIIRVPWAGDAWCTIANLCRKALQEAWCHFSDPWVPGGDGITIGSTMSASANHPVLHKSTCCSLHPTHQACTRSRILPRRSALSSAGGCNESRLWAFHVCCRISGSFPPQHVNDCVYCATHSTCNTRVSSHRWLS